MPTEVNEDKTEEEAADNNGNRSSGDQSEEQTPNASVPDENETPAVEREAQDDDAEDMEGTKDGSGQVSDSSSIPEPLEIESKTQPKWMNSNLTLMKLMFQATGTFIAYQTHTFTV